MNLPKKIMIFGRSGSGKSTFSHSLAQETGIPLHHLDRHFYTAGWVERNYDDFLDIQYSIVGTKSWIIDGNATESLAIRYSEADLVLYFNYSKWLCYLRVLKRRLRKNRAIQDRAEGCKETITWNLLFYMWNFEERVARQIQFFKEVYPQVKFVEINSDKDLRELKNKLLEGYQ